MLIRDEKHRRALRALVSLSRADAELVLACAIDELSTADAARRLQLPVGTIKSKLRKARRLLRELQEREDAPAHATRSAS